MSHPRARSRVRILRRLDNQFGARALLALAAIATALAVIAYLALHHASTAYRPPPNPAESQAGNRGPLNLSINLSAPGQKFLPGAVGLSVEADELATNDLSAKHRSLVALMRLLGPSVLRLGGNSVDKSWWTSQQEPAPRWATNVVTPDDLTQLRALLLATNWKAILGVNLGHFDPARAADEARAAKRILGAHLLGFEIGNEPDHYTRPGFRLRAAGYSPSSYLQELSSYRVAMEKSAGPINVYGPDLSTPAWLAQLAAADPSPFSVITQHYYATRYSAASNVCSATPVPTAGDLLSTAVIESENELLSAMLAAGRAANRPLRLSETSATGSCDTSGGPLTSPVFASALWALDWILRTASSGVQGINFHGYFGRCAPNSSSPICAPNEADAERGQVLARPIYYGLLAARDLEGGDFLPTQLTGAADLSTYATRRASGLLTLALDNWSSTAKARVLVHLEGYTQMHTEPLSAPSMTAATRVSFAHSTLDAAGLFHPRVSTQKHRHGVFGVEVPPASALIVTFSK